jgi:hypothetical protein
MLHAAQNNRVNIMEVIYDAGGSLTEIPHNSDIFEDRRNGTSWGTPLRMAVEHGQAEVVAWLVKKRVEDDRARV